MMAGHHTGQTLNDRINAARYALAGQGLARVVCKATTEEMIAPKKKHIDYLLQCTNEPNVSIPQLANLLIERTSHSSWIVVFKALVTVHHLMCYGNERFTQYLASSNCNFQLSNYLDKSGPKCYDMSIFIRRYAKYLNTKALSYRTVAFDFTKIKRGGDGQLRAMNVDKLLKTIPVLQSQIDSLLEFDCNAGDLTNGVINAAFFLLFKDLIRLFACYNDGIINTLEKYFEMANKKQAREALEIYKKFLIRMNKVGEFLKTAENVGIDKGEIPDLTKAPSSLLDAMEQHLAQLEGKKPGTTTTTTSTNGESKGDETSALRAKAIEEEEQFLNKLKSESGGESEKHQQDKKVNNPFLSLSSPTAAKSEETKSSDILDLFANDSTGPTTASKPSANEDLFSLNSSGAVDLSAASSNPFADILTAMNTVSPAAGGVIGGGYAASAFPGTAANNSNNFATSDNFAAAFGTASNSNIASIPRGFDAFGDVLQPQNVSALGPKASNSTTTTAVPTSSNNTNSVPSSASSQNLLKGDLDSSLAMLAQNLDINGPKGAGGFKKGGQFNQSPKSMMKTGTPMSSSSASSTNASTTNMWTMSSATASPVGPLGGWGGAANPMMTPGATAGWAPSPVASASFGQPTILGTIPGQPSMMMPSNAMSTTMPMSFGMRPNMMPGAVSVLPAGVTPATLSSALANRSMANSTAPSLSQVSDPFGAL